jgi:dCTP deaminase
VILTDREIRLALLNKQVIIDPHPADVAFSSTSVDLTLAETLHVFKKPSSSVRRVIDPTHSEYDVDEALAEVTEEKPIPENGYELPQHLLVLGWTTEYINIPVDARLSARVEGKSSLARLGLGVHITAPTIHAGFDGQIRLELHNNGPVPILLKPGMRICQLIFELTFGTAEKGYQGQFVGQIAG